MTIKAETNTNFSEVSQEKKDSMKAIVQEGYGSPEVLKLKEIDKPAVSDDEVLVRVHAAGIAIGDWLIMKGQPYIARPAYGLLKPKNTVAGLEMAGQVEAVGRNVSRFQPGDEVFGWSSGAFAEYVTVSEDALTHKPESITPEQAAAVPISALTALQAVHDAGR
jgi:NADPH:quinone reductase-like Zn-dependent oxidoreductase